jgi:hypothetical protein
MDQSPWGILSAFILGVIAKPLQEAAARRFLRPKLVLTFDPKDSSCVIRTSMRIRKNITLPISDPTQPPVVAPIGGYTQECVFVRVRVHNLTSRMARNCCVYLTAIRKQTENGRFVPTEYCDSIPLCWSYDQNPTQIIDVPGGVNRHVDVFKTVKGSSALTPSFITIPFMYSEDFFSKQGTYRYQITLTADELPAERIEIEVQWKGGWDDFCARQVT